MSSAQGGGSPRSESASVAIDWTIHAFERVSSTNEIARRLAGEGAPEGTVVVAAEQTGGYGRRGTLWLSPRGGLWFSAILRPGAPAERAGLLCLAGAVAVVQAVRGLTGIPARIKWPNDVYVKGGKLGGVMIESVGSEALVLGAGLNVNMGAGALSEIKPSRAGTIMRETGRELDLLRLLDTILGEFGMRYLYWKRGGGDELVEEWRDLSLLVGEQVFVKQGDREPVEGSVFSLEDDGSIVIRLADGRQEVFPATGDVTLRLAGSGEEA